MKAQLRILVQDVSDVFRVIERQVTSIPSRENEANSGRKKARIAAGFLNT
ncbi:hypothetical protein [Pseudomonas mucidolens]|uniref:Uncharacterized protein n=1 Tax=Pseudomonas mucidolens TaxID=46679 RepID=A0A1H2NYX1_9PSED|nr:hypothetical protein [Pseudomonas mucidolens]SDV10608.1 hypothetical protein SAMN05216202_5067 [Pseudomonas mucidolens]SQH36976.1 Uncharacterised protein [Pseudomonas mucidolens]